jgi:CheY-like chemotaxis protein
VLIHVLLIEDHYLLRPILERTLASAGYRVTVAESSDQAVSLIEGGIRPDILLSDVRMTGRMNGLDFARLTRQRYPSTAILLQTGYADADTGDFRVLRKPYDPDMLLSAIAELLACRTNDLPAR